jgi:flagellar hook-associated protein 1
MSFGGINLMRSALQAHQRSLQIIGHNVANAKTPGYSRQLMNLTAAEPSRLILSGGKEGQFGNGVREAEIIRFRDEFLDRQFRSRSSLAGYFESLNVGALQLELIFNEPSEAGLRMRFDEFWEAVQSLNNRPQDLDTRIQFRERAKALVDHVRFVHKQLLDARRNYNTLMVDKVHELNSAFKQIAALNQRIRQAEAGGATAGDLQDKRDLLLDDLAKMAGATVVRSREGDVSVWIGNMLVVSNVFHAQILEDRLPGEDISSFRWALVDEPTDFRMGELGSLQRLRDELVPTFISHLDTLMRTFGERINEVHRAGYGLDSVSGRNLYIIGAGDLNIAINPLIMADPDTIAAAYAPTPPATTISVGDGRNAWDLLQVRDEPILSGGLVGPREVTAYEYLRAMMTLLGIESQNSGRNSEAYLLQVSQADEQRMSIAGVSLDEEMTKMIEHQHAFNAAARVITSMDEVLAQVIDRMGVVGR